MRSTSVPIGKQEWLCEADLRNRLERDISEKTLLAWRSSKGGCRYLAGKRLRHRVREVSPRDHSGVCVQRIEYWSAHVGEIAATMMKERQELLRRHPSITQYTCREDLPARYKRGGIGAPIFTADLESFGFPKKRVRSLRGPVNWRDRPCPYLGGRKLDAALLFDDSRETGQCRWRWVWAESHVQMLGEALKLKASRNAGVNGIEQAVPNECRENRDPARKPWSTARVVALLKLSRCCGKKAPRAVLYSWRRRCVYMPDHRGMKWKRMRNGRIVWYDCDVQLLHKQLFAAHPTTREYHNVELMENNRDSCSETSPPDKLRLVSTIVSARVRFSWLIRSPNQTDQESIKYVYMRPSEAMVIFYADVQSVVPSEQQPPVDGDSPRKVAMHSLQHELAHELRSGETLEHSRRASALSSNRWSQMLAPTLGPAEWNQYIDPVIHAALVLKAFVDQIALPHHKETREAIGRIMSLLKATDMVPHSRRASDGEPLGGDSDSVSRKEPYGFAVSQELLSSAQIGNPLTPSGKIVAIGFGCSSEAGTVAHCPEQAGKQTTVLRDGDDHEPVPSRDVHHLNVVGALLSIRFKLCSRRGPRFSEKSKRVQRECFVRLKLRGEKTATIVKLVTKMFGMGLEQQHIYTYSKRFQKNYPKEAKQLRDDSTGDSTITQNSQHP